MTVRALRGRSLAITGVDGFVGRHVARLAAKAGASVYGVSRTTVVDDALDSVLSGYHSADLRWEWPRALDVDIVIHLAGRAAVGPSFGEPQSYINDNSAMVTTMCEALLERGSGARIVGVSTGAVYRAPAAGGDVIEESSPVAPTSPYAVSKLTVEHQLDYYSARGLSTVIARPFNHIGPGQGRGFLLPDLVARLRESGVAEALVVGDLSTQRDYSDVRDVAAAYLALASSPELGHRIYNVASGVATSGHDLLELVCAALGRSVPPLIVDEAFTRPSDPRRIAGSSSRLRGETGWSPSYSLSDSVSDAVASSS